MRKQHTNAPGKSPSLEGGIDEGERRFRLLADAMPQMVWTVEPDGRVDYVNQRWITYTGLTLEKIQAGDWLNLIFPRILHPNDLQSFIDRRTSALESGEAFEIEYRMKRASDGIYRWQLGRGVPIKDFNGHIVKWVGTSTDIEDQKQLQTAAERANRAKSDFLSGMSHELRSPLNAILGFTQLMASDSPPPTPSQQASIDQILRAGWHLLDLINEVLDLAKIESGQVSLSQEPVSLAEVMRECHGMIEPQAQQRGMRMSFPRIRPPLLRPWRSDPG